jgi:cystathionine beta-synthase
MKRHKGITNNILDLVGDTPLIRLNKIANKYDGDFLVKYEAFNPGHSMKDRIAIHIVEEAERRGILKEGNTVIETTSGNTGFSVALVCIIKGYDCILAVNSKASTGKINMLKAMGAKVYVCPANVSADDPRSYYEVAKRLHAETADSVYINQYFNKLNSEAHYLSTGR